MGLPILPEFWHLRCLSWDAERKCAARLKDASVAVYLTYRRLADAESRSFLTSRAETARRHGASLRTIERADVDLRGAGLLTFAHAGKGTRYTLTDPPAPVSDVGGGANTSRAESCEQNSTDLPGLVVCAPERPRIHVMPNMTRHANNGGAAFVFGASKVTQQGDKNDATAVKNDAACASPNSCKTDGFGSKPPRISNSDGGGASLRARVRADAGARGRADIGGGRGVVVVGKSAEVGEAERRALDALKFMDDGATGPNDWTARRLLAEFGAGRCLACLAWARKKKGDGARPGFVVDAIRNNRAGFDPAAAAARAEKTRAAAESAEQAKAREARERAAAERKRAAESQAVAAAVAGWDGERLRALVFDALAAAAEREPKTVGLIQERLRKSSLGLAVVCAWPSLRRLVLDEIEARASGERRRVAAVVDADSDRGDE